MKGTHKGCPYLRLSGAGSWMCDGVSVERNQRRDFIMWGLYGRWEMDGFQKIVISRFDGGLNNSVGPFLIGQDDWARGQNMIVRGNGDVDVRGGYIRQHDDYTVGGSAPVLGFSGFICRVGLLIG